MTLFVAVWMLLALAVVVVYASRVARRPTAVRTVQVRARAGAPLVLVPLIFMTSHFVQDMTSVKRAVTDVSSAARNSLDGVTISALDRYGEETAESARLVAFIPPGAPEFRTLLVLLNQFERQGIEVDILDPDRDVSIARSYGLERLGQVFAEVGTRRVAAEGQNEADVVTAILRAHAGDHALCWSEGHGETSMDDRVLGRALATAGRHGFSVRPTKLRLGADALEGCDVFAVVAPRDPMLPAERQVWQSYLDDGGRALLLLDPDTTSDETAASWLAQFPFEPLGITQDPEGSLVGDERVLVSDRFPTMSPVVDRLSSLVFVGARGLHLLGDDEASPDATVSVLAQTSPAGQASGVSQPALALLWDRSSLVGEGAEREILRSRVLVVGDADWLGTQLLPLGGNERFLLQGLGYLVEVDTLVAIPDQPVPSLLILTAADARKIDLAVYAVPVLVVGALATLRLFSRRRRSRSRQEDRSAARRGDTGAAERGGDI